jgi:menaquinol-cytochrome c reductase iron-sulfur subunit
MHGTPDPALPLRWAFTSLGIIMDSESFIANAPEVAADTSVDSTLPRRGFLQRVSALLAAIVAGIVGVPALRALASPVRAQPASDNWIKVADDTALLDIGTPIRLDFTQTQTDAWVETRALNSVWLFTEDGETFKAYNGRCTHLGCGYVYDKVRKTFVCPCHRGQFDVKTGAVLGGPPPRPLDELAVQVRDASVYVQYRDFRLGVAERIEA